ncbi:hypothetical protein [Bosea thiooxidans]
MISITFTRGADAGEHHGSRFDNACHSASHPLSCRPGNRGGKHHRHLGDARKKCGRPLSTVVVEPMGLSGEDFSCDFTRVSRKGDTVRWRGACSFGVDKETNVVTARLSKGMLRYRFDRQGWNGPLQRCP